MENVNFKKKFGQNFLSDKNLLSSIVLDADTSNEDTILEIGAGAGALTEQLALKAKKVISFEIDKDLEPILCEKFKDYNNVKFIYDDFLNFSDDILQRITGKDYKVVANLPYYITSPIIFKLLNLKYPPKVIVIMVQKEVGERICAKPGNREYGVLSAVVNYAADTKITRVVSRKMFYPVPNVDSCVVRLTIKRQISAEFVAFLKQAFSMKRKTLVNNLSKSLTLPKDMIINLLNDLGVSDKVRAEDLDSEALLNIHLKLLNCIK